MLASREMLRNTVQNVLFDAAQAYMDVLRDTAILDIRRRNVLFLDEQVRAANERFNVGENTRTDVAQARAALANARAAREPRGGQPRDQPRDLSPDRRPRSERARPKASPTAVSSRRRLQQAIERRRRTTTR